MISKKTKILVFGNILLKEDSLPLKLIPELQKTFNEITFLEFDPNENLKPDEGRLILIDTVLGIDQALVLNDIEAIEENKLYSPHDLDLGFNLKLLYKLGELKELTIFAVPPDMNETEALRQLKALINEYLNT